MKAKVVVKAKETETVVMTPVIPVKLVTKCKEGEETLFLKTPTGEYVYNIALPNNNEIVRFVSIVKEINAYIYLDGLEEGHHYIVNAKNILGVLYASELYCLKCVSDVNIMGEIARFIVEDDEDTVTAPVAE